MELNKIYNIDCLEGLKQLEDNSIDCCITSPPYWALRDYGVEGQLGLETRFQEYINKLCNIFDEVKRVLKKDGSCWVNMGDTYMGNSSYSEKGRQCFGYDKIGMINKKKWLDPKYPIESRLIGREHIEKCGIESKSLCQIPSRFAIEMCDRGWILRNEIIWHKPNCMPSSVKDRFTVDFEKIFFFTKNKKYYFEQQLEPYTKPMNRWGGIKLEANGKSDWDDGTGQTTYRTRNMRPNPNGKNKRCVWRVPTKPFKEAHFATYPEDLIKPCILAGCPEKGIVLDPFMGAGTTAKVALDNNRSYIGFELNNDYIKIAEDRLKDSKDNIKQDLLFE
jgi:site-specific DNA-methyltransferase (adenine-specific)